MRDVGRRGEVRLSSRPQGAGILSLGGWRMAPDPLGLLVMLTLSHMVASGGPRCEGLTTGVPRFSGLIISSVSNMADKSKAGKGDFDLWPEERPPIAIVKKWFEANTPRLKQEWRALLAGRTPTSLVKFKPRSVPPALTAGVDDVTAAMEQQRVVQRMAIEDANTTNAEELKLGKELIRAEWFDALELSLEKCPVLLKEGCGGEGCAGEWPRRQRRL